MCQILTQSARKSSGKGGRYNGRTTTADRAGTSKREETSDKGRDRRKRTDGSESTVGQSDATVIPDSYAEKGIQKNGERTAGDRPDFKLGRGSTGAVSDRAGEIQRSDRNDRKAATDGNCGIRHREKDAEGYPIMAEHEVVNSQVERLAIIQDRYFKQCRQGAADFGLTVSSRCRLIIPKAPEAPKTNKFKDKFA